MILDRLSIALALVLAASALGVGTVALSQDDSASPRVETPVAEQPCDLAWRLFSEAQTDGAAHRIYGTKVVPLCGLPTPTGIRLP